MEGNKLNETRSTPTGQPNNTRQTTNLYLSRIVADDEFQLRDELDPNAIKRYAIAYSHGEPLPPLTVVKQGDLYRLVAGFHRLEALKRIGAHEAEVVVIETPTSRAKWEAARSNLAHGLRLSRKEKRRAFDVYIKAKQHRDHRGHLKSLRQMERDFRGEIYRHTIRDWLKKSYPTIYRQLKGDMPVNSGGLREEKSVMEHEQKAREFFHGGFEFLRNITCPVAKGRLIAELREMTEKVAEGEDWEPPNDDF